MRLRVVFPLVALCALAAAAPALADPHVSRADTKQISGLVDRFIHDVVLRENLPDGWLISGPQMRGGITKKDWYAGHELPVQRLKLIGDDWSHAWYATSVTRDEIGITVTLRIGRGEDAETWAEEMVFIRARGTWLANGLYTNAIYRLGSGHHGSCLTSNCKTTGLNVFAPASGPGSALGPRTLGIQWLWVAVGTIVGGALTALLGFAVYGRYRNHRAWAEYLNSKSPEERLALGRE